jgi:hypothetical protein
MADISRKVKQRLENQNFRANDMIFLSKLNLPLVMAKGVNRLSHAVVLIRYGSPD